MFRHFPRLSINSVVIIGGTTKKFVSVLVYSRAAPAQRALTSLGTGFLGLSGRGGRGEIGIWGPRFCWAVFFTVSTDDKLMLKTCFNWLVFYVFFMLKNWLMKKCHLSPVYFKHSGFEGWLGRVDVHRERRRSEPKSKVVRPHQKYHTSEADKPSVILTLGTAK